MKKVFSIPGAPKPVGAYSQAVKIGDTLFVSGQIPINPFSGELVLTDIQSSTEQVMQNIKALVTEAGMKMDNIVKVSIFLKDMGDFSAVNEVYSSFFKDYFPARETVQVAALPLNAPVEISCIAIEE